MTGKRLPYPPQGDLHCDSDALMWSRMDTHIRAFGELLPAIIRRIAVLSGNVPPAPEPSRKPAPNRKEPA